MRNRFAIFLVIVPSMTMRSDCRSDPSGRTPNRSRSWRAPLAAPNSALQQAVVILTGQREYILAQLITFLMGSVSMTLWTMSLSFPTHKFMESGACPFYPHLRIVGRVNRTDHFLALVIRALARLSVAEPLLEALDGLYCLFFPIRLL